MDVNDFYASSKLQ